MGRVIPTLTIQSDDCLVQFASMQAKIWMKAAPMNHMNGETGSMAMTVMTLKKIEILHPGLEKKSSKRC